MNTNYHDDNGDEVDSMLCIPFSRLIKSGFIITKCSDNTVLFVNVGGEAVKEEGNCAISVVADRFFDGGDVLRTDERIIDAGDMPAIYQSARFGNFSYRFSNLSPGEYFVDLQFAEIVNINGPKGMRVFDVFIQEEKVVSALDIYSIVGANKPLQVVDIRVSVGLDGVVVIRFQGVCGSPVVNGICIKQASRVPADQEEHEYVICSNCDTEIEISSCQKQNIRIKSTAKLERKIEELKNLCQLKSEECYQAWMSLTAANEQLEKVRMELDNKYFQNLRLDQAMGKQAAKLKDISSRYEYDKKHWLASIRELERKVETMKQEHSQLSSEAHNCADSIPELNKMIFGVQALVAQCEDLKLKFSEEQAKRKKLYNQMQEAKGNIRVFCRCRPLSKEETSAGYATVVDFSAAKDGDLGILTGGSAKKIFKFDRVYTPKDNQADVFEDASPMVVSVLDGYNVCIFAYGQTGTGKTFTMEGTEQSRGVNYRTLEQLFKVVEERKETFTYNISVSVLEVYNEQIRDLLATAPASKRLEIRQASEGFHHVPGIVEAKVENIKEVWDVLLAGSNARAVGSNNVNEHSSRSHCMLCILVRAKNLINGECTKSKLWLVDLAGSERLAKTEVQGERLKEAQNINRSLSALGDVISALATKSNHIPYRNSKITHLLQDSIGGDSKTLMFVQVSPSEQDLGETLSSLNFASRVRGIELAPAKKQVDANEHQKFRLMVDKLKQELRSKDDALRKLEENLHTAEAKAKDKDQLCRNQQEKLSEVEVQLASKTELSRQLEKQVLRLSRGMKEKDEICSKFQLKVQEPENKLKDREHTASMTLQHKEQSTYSSEKLQVTPNMVSVLKAEKDSPNIRSLSSTTRTINVESELLKGTDSLRELRRKKQIQSKGSENSFNSFLLSAPLVDKRVPSAESNKARQIDPSKAFSRITRSGTKSVTTGQRAFSDNNFNRDQVRGGKESSSRLKMWLR
ncbi:hypothetical protein SLEP1_g42045 [Rubroshorea leprosula]|uniref:Kinesin-like protein n=1 Tax=Rubroshorea leprosula TaxID=152421 RepID=A0AAV5L8I8_9ROSI|nr:hypothetical protein SLEP1_g42045 [Rubroshorea leprosula]